MLKFFRKYNKWILGVGGSLLMIVFLIQPVMGLFQKDRDTIPIGEYDGGELTQGDLKQADFELNALKYFDLRLDPDGDNDNRDALRWALALKDAERLGVSASLAEVNAILTAMGMNEADVQQIAARNGATPAFIHQALRHWLVVQQYKELVAGQSHLAGSDRAVLLRSGANSERAQNIYDAIFLNAMAYGTSKMSQPLLEHFLQDQGARVTGRVVLVHADQFLADVDEPGEAQVQSLYEQYKDALPGQGEPYGFGYRVPDRVKIEYLAIPMDQARQSIKVTEADALAHYRDNPDRYTDSASGEKAPYDAVREDVIEDLRGQLAFELVEKMAKTAYGLLYEDLRGMDKVDDYRVIENPSSLKSLRQVAEGLESEYGLAPVLHSGTGQWINARDLSRLPGIGQSRLADNLRVDFTSYVLSAHELEPDRDNPLLPRRLQVHVVGSPMIGLDTSRYVFRLTAAQPTRQPTSLDEVREQVVRDARELAAYKKLLAEKDNWQTQAVDSGLEAVAERAKTDVIPLMPVTRRVPLPNGMLGVPVLAGVGQSEKFIEAYFATAKQAREQVGDVATAPAAAVTAVVGVDPQLALAVYKVDGYDPLTRQAFKELADQPILPLKIDTTLLAGALDVNPLSYEALARRLNYNDGAEQEMGEPAEAGSDTEETSGAGA